MIAERERGTSFSRVDTGIYRVVAFAFLDRGWTNSGPLMNRLPPSLRAAKLLASFLGFAAFLGLSRPASAQTTASASRVSNSNGDGMDTHLFRPALDSKGFFSVNGSDILGHNNISFGLILDWGHNIMRTRSDDVPDDVDGDQCEDEACDVAAGDGSGVKALIANSFQATFGFNYGLFNRAVVGISAPVILMNGNPAYQIGPNAALYNSADLDSQKLSTLALHGKYRITRIDRGPGLALSLQFGIPIADAPHDLGADPGFWYWPQVIFEHGIDAGSIVQDPAHGYRRTLVGRVLLCRPAVRKNTRVLLCRPAIRDNTRVLLCRPAFHSLQRIQHLLAQPETLHAREMPRELHVDRVEHRLGAVSALAFFLVPRSRLAHLLEHLEHEHRLELLRDAQEPIALRAWLGLGLRSRFGARAEDQVVDPFDVHRITTSARSAPDAFSACMMAMMSRGVTPRVFNARTTSASVVPSSSATS